MPRIPVYEGLQAQLQPIPNVATRVNLPVVQAPDLGAPARAIAQSGERLAAASNRAFFTALDFEEQANRTAAKQAMVNFDQFSRQTLLGDEGYFSLQGENALRAHDGVVQALTERRQEMADALINNRQRDLFLDATQNDFTNALDRTAEYRMKQQAAWQVDVSRAVIANARDEALARFQRGDTAGTEEAIATGKSEVLSSGELAGRRATASWAAAQYESTTRRAIVEQIATVNPLAAEAYLEQNRKRLTGSDAAELEAKLATPVRHIQAQVMADQIIGAAAKDIPLDQVAAAIVQAESGGQEDANNPRSTARGAGQFTKATWLDVVKQYRPDLAAGKSDEALLALRTDPALSLEMTQAYAASNKESLQNAGLPATPGTLSLAHFAGPEGARRILSATPDAPIEAVLGGKAIEANPFLRGKTASDVRIWAEQRIGLGPLAKQMAATDKISDPLLRDQVRSELNTRHHQENAVRAEQDRLTTETNARAFFDLDYRAAQADPSVRETIYKAEADGIITNQQLYALNHKYNSALIAQGRRDGEQSALLRRAEAAFSGMAYLDPKSRGDRNAADALYTLKMQQWAATPPEDLPAIKAAFAGQIGLVPETLQSEVRGQLRGGSAEQKVAAADLLGRLRSTNPQLMNDFDSKDIEAGVALDNLVSAGVQPDLAAKAIEDRMRIPETELNALKVDYTTKVGKGEKSIIAAKSFLANKFDPGWFSFAPDVPDYLAVEFNDIAATYYRGDLDAARIAAANEIQKVWGNSEITGRRVLMKDAPELRYGLPGMSVGDNAKWMKEQLFKDLEQADPTFYERIKDRGFTFEVVPGVGGTPLYSVRPSDDMLASGVVWAPDRSVR